MQMLYDVNTICSRCKYGDWSLRVCLRHRELIKFTCFDLNKCEFIINEGAAAAAAEQRQISDDAVLTL
jgi:hypothetical protein